MKLLHSVYVLKNEKNRKLVSHRWFWLFLVYWLPFETNVPLLLARTDKNLNSRTAKDSQGLARTCQILDQSLHMSLLDLQVLEKCIQVRANPGDTLPRTDTGKNPKSIQEL